MRTSRAVLAALVALAVTPSASSADPAARCPDNQMGRSVTLTEWAYASVCVRAQLCGFVLGVVYGVEITVNGATLVSVCPDTGPTHVDPGTLYWLEQSCPVLAGLSPGVPGVVDIGPDGDVSVDGSAVLDCPPHGS